MDLPFTGSEWSSGAGGSRFFRGVTRDRQLQRSELNEDEEHAFFLFDTYLRLRRVVELAAGYFFFVLLLSLRLLPAGRLHDVLMPGACWFVVFLPLFLLDVRTLGHSKYLYDNQVHFPGNSATQSVVKTGSEFLYKFMLCLHLSLPMFKKLSLTVVMLPFVAGYCCNFLIGRMASNAREGADGCHILGSVISEIGGVLRVVLVVMVSLKVNSSRFSYDWEAAFWPCWGVVGVLVMAVVIFSPFCLMAMFQDTLQMLMLSWAIFTATGLAFCGYYGSVMIVKVLEGSECDHMESKGCQNDLRGVLYPWLVFLPIFCVVTLIILRPLACILHQAWFQMPRRDNAADFETTVVTRILQPVPDMLFRVTPTFYSRVYRPSDTDSFSCASATACSSSNALSTLSQHCTSGRVSQSGTELQLNENSVDLSTTMLTALGSTFAEIVEVDQLCFICFDGLPEAVFLECGHAGFCSSCAVELLKRQDEPHCPICREPVAHALKLWPDIPVPAQLLGGGSRHLGDASTTKSHLQHVKRFAITVSPINFRRSETGP
uniref:RING-type domain-containing protein n=1 Tax=Noctiluca scintillans TaxID=2966 RepID=A0A7S1B1X7_NOCSC|mmetsp:Transcript_8992/g.25086  ORF Transcript_8992/g.25086 Transcript_8992/m.25086 type:complete len:545 (+) Transcript_8992:138-1772(+)